MQSEKPTMPDDKETRKPRISFLQLALILVVGLTVISIIMILAIFFLSDSNRQMKDVNVNVSVPSSTPYRSDKPIIQKPPPQPTPPKVGKQPTSNMHMPSMSPTPARNVNEQLTPKPPSRTSASESPP